MEIRLPDAAVTLDSCCMFTPIEKVKIQLKANKWYFRKQKVNVDIPLNAIMYVQPSIESEENYKAYSLSNIICVKHEKDKIIFKAQKKPHIDINVMLCFLRFK